MKNVTNPDGEKEKYPINQKNDTLEKKEKLENFQTNIFTQIIKGLH